MASAIVLVAVGGETKYGLYVGTGMYYILVFILFVPSFIHVVVEFLLQMVKIGSLGLFVSWQYGSCYSWVAQKGDISGRPASIFFIG